MTVLFSMNNAEKLFLSNGISLRKICRPNLEINLCSGVWPDSSWIIRGWGRVKFPGLLGGVYVERVVHMS
jgi:hypothetical protein